MNLLWSVDRARRLMPRTVSLYMYYYTKATNGPTKATNGPKWRWHKGHQWAKVAMGAHSVTWWVRCASHAGFEIKSPL